MLYTRKIHSNVIKANCYTSKLLWRQTVTQTKCYTAGESVPGECVLDKWALGEWVLDEWVLGEWVLGGWELGEWVLCESVLGKMLLKGINFIRQTTTVTD